MLQNAAFRDDSIQNDDLAILLTALSIVVVARLDCKLFGVFAIFAEQRLLHFEYGRLDRLEAAGLEHVSNHAENVFAFEHVFRQKVAHSFR